VALNTLTIKTGIVLGKLSWSIVKCCRTRTLVLYCEPFRCSPTWTLRKY